MVLIALKRNNLIAIFLPKIFRLKKTDKPCLVEKVATILEQANGSCDALKLSVNCDLIKL